MVLTALEQCEPAERRLVDDDLAARFLPAPTRWLVTATQPKMMRRLMMAAMDRDGPGLWANLAARKRYITDKVTEALDVIDDTPRCEHPQVSPVTSAYLAPWPATRLPAQSVRRHRGPGAGWPRLTSRRTKLQCSTPRPITYFPVRKAARVGSTFRGRGQSAI